MEDELIRKGRLGKAALSLWQDAERNIRITAHGSSMSPLIQSQGDLSVHLMEATRLKVGDVFAFWTDHGLVIHRLIKKKKRNGQWWFCQKGDNCSDWGWIPERDVLGRVERISGKPNTPNTPNTIIMPHTIIMTQRPWSWINILLGLVSWFWITVAEYAQALKITFLGHRKTPRLPGVNTLFFKLFRQTMCWIVRRDNE
jgi:hypothetical protein